MTKRGEEGPVASGAGPPREPGQAQVYCLLDGLVLALQEYQHVSQAMGCAVETLREALGVETVFWYSTAHNTIGPDPPKVGLPADACRSLAARLVVLAQAQPDDNDTLLWTGTAGEPDAGVIRVQGAIVTRLGRSRSWLVALNVRRGRPFDPADAALVALVKRLALNQHAQAQRKMKDLLLGLIECLSATIEAKDTYTAGHSERVARIGQLIGRQMGLPAGEVHNIYLAGLLHDVGKVGVQDAVLQKNGPLSAAEVAHIQEHVVIGDRIVSSIRPFESLRPGVRHHHERYDGAGYPDKLRGDAVPTLARILAVADACDAMMSPRRYRPARTPPQIDQIFTRGSGAQWDPTVVQHFMACRHQIYPPIYQKGVGDSAAHAIDQMLDALGDASGLSVPWLPGRKEEG
jgi:hypothetical protein